ncbi:hypothetical protein HRbin17_00184 [bacterium HR17]|uniref:PEP-CTERM protein-sorting domain-containing protein n=1 Tax=Candidatus Fervidibacter japonicus TaxID=2035412 RepID=A0A2H5X942_9BACT|nr:hypothetical protein HRbin17_00184 [bacterium HR17]
MVTKGFSVRVVLISSLLGCSALSPWSNACPITGIITSDNPTQTQSFATDTFTDMPDGINPALTGINATDDASKAGEDKCKRKDKDAVVWLLLSGGAAFAALDGGSRSDASPAGERFPPAGGENTNQPPPSNNPVHTPEPGVGWLLLAGIVVWGRFAPRKKSKR